MKAALVAVAAAMVLTHVATRPVRADAPAVTYALAQIAEDSYFDQVDFDRDGARRIIADGMTELACTRASRMLNAWGAFTYCIAE